MEVPFTFFLCFGTNVFFFFFFFNMKPVLSMHEDMTICTLPFCHTMLQKLLCGLKCLVLSSVMHMTAVVY